MGVGLWDFLQRWLAFLLRFSINRHSAANKWNWCHVRSGRVVLWGRKREQRKKLVYLHSAAEQMERLSSICMRQAAASLSPWPLLWDSDLGTQWKRMGQVWAVVLRLYAVAGKSGWAAWLHRSRPRFRQWRNATPFSQHLPGHMQSMFVNDGWKGGGDEGNVTKTLL